MTKDVMEIESTTEVDAPYHRETTSDAADERREEVSSAPTRDDVESVLELETRRGWRRRLAWWAAASLAVIGAVTVAYHYLGTSTPSTQYRTAEAERGPLTVFVSATGALAPTDEVDVGSELSGIVLDVYVDANESVRAGQPLAELDTSKLKAQAAQARASLEAARARAQEADASLTESRLAFNRAKKLHDAELLSESDLDTAEATFLRSEAALSTARAQVSQAEATLSTIETDLTKAVIRSPVDGVVLTRNVEPGQTVAASFQAPVLFKIAQDLRRMELRVDVDEADVSRVKAGQEATFTVDAYPDRNFPATIKEVSYASKTVAGVVTYEAVLDVENPDLLLRPGMTATADVTVETVKDALLVPNAALRFSPPTTASASSGSGGGLVSLLLPRRPRRTTEAETKAGTKGQKVWTLQDGQLVPITITTGSSDGTHTVVTSGPLEPGVPLVTDIVPRGR
jgi:HlyD family secretion protein